ncbi:hypothetical protein PO124_11700 [Bacillus licheniformis]|nr:hypothetical protein [Bacillus licheniformis]
MRGAIFQNRHGTACDAKAKARFRETLVKLSTASKRVKQGDEGDFTFHQTLKVRWIDPKSLLTEENPRLHTFKERPSDERNCNSRHEKGAYVKQPNKRNRLLQSGRNRRFLGYVTSNICSGLSTNAFADLMKQPCL